MTRLHDLVVLACIVAAVTFAGTALTFAADTGVSVQTASFKAIYDTAISSHSDSQIVVSREADRVAKEHKFVEAAAKYMAAASQPFISGNFERARPNFDKAFIMAAKSPVADQKELLTTLSELVGKCREIRDYDIWKYLAQQRLRLMQNQPGTTAAQRYAEIQTLAYSCSRHKRYKEAEALLLETLQDLESIHPVPNSVGHCENTLARVYEESGDLDHAKEYYSRWVQFARETHDSDQLTRALEEYTNFLIKHKVIHEVVPIADEYFKQANSPQQARWRDRVPFVMMARGLSDLDLSEADKYYRAGFENEKAMTQYSMNAGYGQTICKWAEMLNKHGKVNESISVLNEGMTFCRNSKWPDALDSYMPQMAGKCEQYLRVAGRTKDVNDLHASFVREMAAHKNSLAQAKERRLFDELKNPSTPPVQRVSALTEVAYRSFDAGNCDEAMQYLNEAVKAYEDHSDSKESPRMYGFFLDISRRLTKCGHAQDSKPMLLRIIRARMKYGFPDPDVNVTFVCGFAPPIQAFDDLVPSGDSWGRNAVDPAQRALLKELAEEAKSTDKAATVVFLLTRLSTYEGFDEGKAALLEEIETWKRKENDPNASIGIMMRLADLYMYLKQYDKMMDKCNAAVLVAEDADPSKKNSIRQVSLALDRFANTLMTDNQLDKAKDLYLTGYKCSLRENGDDVSQELMKDIERLANKYRDSNSVSSGANLLEKCLEMTKADVGEDGTLTRAWLMKLSSYLRSSR